MSGTSSSVEEDVENMREMLKRAVSFDNVSVFADMPTQFPGNSLDGHSGSFLPDITQQPSSSSMATTDGTTTTKSEKTDATTTSSTGTTGTTSAASNINNGNVGTKTPTPPPTPQLQAVAQQPYYSPSPSQGRAAVATKKLCIVMVGLPARGKSHIARCLERYLNWLGFNAAVFNVGLYRRKLLGGCQNAEFFNPRNQKGVKARMELAMECLRDMLRWFGRGGLVGIYDATNSTRNRRKMVKDKLESCGVRVLFLESICNDPMIIEKNIVETKLRSPDYRNYDPEDAVCDFKRRIEQYKSINETVEDEEMCSYIKIINVGKQLMLNDIQGYAQGKIVSFLLNTHITPRAIYLSRHGESQWNVSGQLGGDPPLTSRGQMYAQCLAKFMDNEFTNKGKPLPQVWTSQLQRTRQTVNLIPSMHMRWRALNEIDAGICEGLTYNSVAKQYPQVAQERKRDKLRYRYPGGESYVDVIHRLEPVILEIERQRGPVLIVAHNAIIRAIYAYLIGKPQDQCPYIDIPLHTVFKLTTRAYGAEQQTFPLDVDSTYQNKTPESGTSDTDGDVTKSNEAQLMKAKMSLDELKHSDFST